MSTMRTLTRAIELMFRVPVAGVDVHSLQCYLDKNGIVTVVSQSLSRVGQVPVKDGSNLGWHVVRRSRIVLGDGLALEDVLQVDAGEGRQLHDQKAPGRVVPTAVVQRQQKGARRRALVRGLRAARAAGRALHVVTCNARPQRAGRHGARVAGPVRVDHGQARAPPVDDGAGPAGGLHEPIGSSRGRSQRDARIGCGARCVPWRGTDGSIRDKRLHCKRSR